MSEYTTIYLRHKNTPLLDYKNHPPYEESKNLSREDLLKAIHEVDEYNRQGHKSFGCELFYLSTTPSRQLTVLPWSESPKVLTKDLLEDILCFYKREIEEHKNAIVKSKQAIDKLELRITKSNVDLYDKINEEIDAYNERINYEEEELEEYQFYYNKFDFLRSILDNESNLESYELIYTKS